MAAGAAIIERMMRSDHDGDIPAGTTDGDDADDQAAEVVRASAR